MKESLTSRVGRIVSGSVNALIDAVENAVPETVMEEAIREVDGAIDEVRAEMGRVLARKHLANTRLMEENRKHEDLAEKIELAVAEDRDDLAEAAIAQQLDIEAQIPVLEQSIAQAGEEEAELEGFIQALQARKREMQEELAQFRRAQKESGTVASTGGGPAGPSVAESVKRAETAFDRIMERSTGLHAGAGTPDVKTAKNLAELDELARKNRIQERLSRFKSGTS